MINKPYCYGKDLNTERRIDYDAEDDPRGVEVLCVSEGVMSDDLEDHLYSKEIEPLASKISDTSIH